MRNKETIKDIATYLQTKEENTLEFDQIGIAEAYQNDNNNQSTTIKILSIFGGVLACLSFLGFLYIAGLYDSEYGSIMVSLFFIIGALWINKAYDKIIIDTMSVSFFLVGFLLLGMGLNQLKADENFIFFSYLVIAFVSLCIVHRYILSFLCIIIINGSILSLIISNNINDLIHLYISILALIILYTFLNEAKIIALSKVASKLYNPIRTGLVLSFLSGLIFLCKKGIIELSTNIIWLSSIIIISAILFFVYKLVDSLDIKSEQKKTIIFLISILILLPTALSPAIPGAILIILLSFSVNYKTGLVTGIIAFLYFVTQYYYDLNLTLLHKSILLFSSGILFSVLYLLYLKKTAGNEKV